MKKIFLKIVIGVVLACILFVCFLYTMNGVTSSKLEADIRSSQKIKDDWTVDEAFPARWLHIFLTLRI